MSLCLVMSNSLKLWSNRETRLFPLVADAKKTKIGTE